MFFSQDLVRLGERGRVGGGCGPCPYFLSLDMYKKADIVFMPYNYVIDPGMRDVLGDRLKDAVVLLDEAHNIGESIFGYFWLFFGYFLVIFWLFFGYFLVIFGYSRMGNCTDVVFSLQIHPTRLLSERSSRTTRRRRRKTGSREGSAGSSAGTSATAPRHGRSSPRSRVTRRRRGVKLRAPLESSLGRLTKRRTTSRRRRSS
jgi:Rad3-related DNA helicase